MVLSSFIAAYFGRSGWEDNNTCARECREDLRKKIVSGLFVVLLLLITRALRRPSLQEIVRVLAETSPGRGEEAASASYSAVASMVGLESDSFDPLVTVMASLRLSEVAPATISDASESQSNLGSELGASTLRRKGGHKQAAVFETASSSSADKPEGK